MITSRVDRYKILVRYAINQGIASSQKELGALMGYSNPSSFSQILNEKVDRPKEFISKLTAIIPNLNPNWIDDDGEMLLSDTPESHIDGKSNVIPFYDAQTTGGINGSVSSSREIAVVKGYVNAGGWFDGRETAAIRHVGNSMLEYPDGCVLAVREVRDARLLVPGKVYVIETSEYRVTKRYQLGSSPDTIALYSSNPEKYDDGRLVYEPFEVLKDDVQRIFLVLGYIVNQSGEIRLINPLEK